MDPREFRETLAKGEPFREAHVEGNVIQNVALLGAVSLNNRIYTEQALKDAAKLYDGAPVYVDHPTEAEMRDREGSRSVMDLAGRVLRPRVVGEQVRGDIEVLDREPTKALFLAIAEQMPGIAGMSHRARGTIEVADDGRETVVSLEQVLAVELVADPATVNGLFESIQKATTGETDMEIKDLTLTSLKEQRPELVKELTEAVTKAVREDLKGDETTKALEAKVTAAETKAEKLAKENDALEVREAARTRQSMIDEKLRDAELPETAVTDHFKQQLKAAKDEAAVDAVIADRKALVESVSTGDGPRQPARDIDALIAEAHKGKKYKPVTPESIMEAKQNLFT